jgi:hypothetical protein
MIRETLMCTFAVIYGSMGNLLFNFAMSLTDIPNCSTTYYIIEFFALLASAIALPKIWNEIEIFATFVIVLTLFKLYGLFAK